MSPVQPPLLPAVRRRHSTRVVIALLVVLFGIPLAVFLAWRLSLANDIRALEQKIRDAGEPLTLAELAALRPSVPDEENAAAALLDLWEEEDPDYWRALNSDARPLPQRKQSDLASILRKSGAEESKVIAALPWNDGQVTAARNSMLLDAERLRRLLLALDRPKCRFPVKIEQGLEAMLPHLPQLRDEVMRLQVRSLLAVSDGDYNSALQAIELIHRLAEFLHDDMSLISQLVRADFYRRMFETVEQMLSFSEISRNELELLSLVVEMADIGDAYHRSLLEERVLALSIFSRTHADLDSFGSSDAGVGDDIGLFQRKTLNQSPFNWFGYFDLDRRYLLRTYEQIIGSSQSGNAEDDLETAEIAKLAAVAAKNPPYKIVSGLMLPGLQKAGQRLVDIKARRRCALAALAVERFRRAHDGTLPASLEELPDYVPEGLWLDPFDGQPLRYRITPDGYRIYSLGPDQLDQQGTRRTDSDDREAYDVVFAVERASESPAE